MTDREKLEVIANLGDHITYKEDIGICYDSALAKVIEDAYMTLKNGVTVQEWISVKDRLPSKEGMIMPFFCYNKNDYCDHSENCDNCEVWVFGKGGKEVPTNADRIRAMSDEELAVFLECFGCCHYCSEHERLSDNRWFFDEKCDEMCAEHCLEWLKQPADEKGE